MIEQTRTTQVTKQKQITRDWYLVDVGNQIVGRMATTIAQKLMGKYKPYFVKNMDCGDYVVVINAKDVQVTGKKESQKLYTNYSGYPGGIRSEAFKDLKARRPEEIIRRAVYGMLPKNKLRDEMITRLYVFSGSEHKYQDKFKNPKS